MYYYTKGQNQDHVGRVNDKSFCTLRHFLVLPALLAEDRSGIFIVFNRY